MRYRHELGNDRWIVEQVFPGKRDGFFIEAGAGNGVGGSACYVLESELNWKGICVEPQPNFHPYLGKTRADVDHRALWSKSGEILEFICFPNRSGRSGIGTVNPSLRLLEKEVKKTIQVETVTLLDLLKEHNAPKVIDYFALDVEGAESHILGGFPFGDPYTILAFSVEGHRCDDIMAANGYVQVKNPFTEVKFERYYIHKSIAPDA